MTEFLVIKLYLYFWMFCEYAVLRFVSGTRSCIQYTKLSLKFVLDTDLVTTLLTIDYKISDGTQNTLLMS